MKAPRMMQKVGDLGFAAHLETQPFGLPVMHFLDGAAGGEDKDIPHGRVPETSSKAATRPGLIRKTV